MLFGHPIRIMQKLATSLLCLALVVMFIFCVNTPEVQAAPDYYRIVVLGDPHLPYKPKLWDKKARQNRVIAAKKSCWSRLTHGTT